MTTNSNAADQSAAAGCDAALQLREASLPLPRGSEQSREEIAHHVERAMRAKWPGDTANEINRLATIAADAILALFSTAHAEGLGKEDYGVQTHVEPQHCTGWRPIDSAPKDGTPVLVAWNRKGHPSIAWWHERGNFHTGIYDRCGSPELYAADWFTHWMPLPAPPSSQGEAEGECLIDRIIRLSLVTELRARANARHSNDEPSPTSRLCARAAALIESLEALVAPLAEVGSELVRSEAGDEWKVEIPDDKAIFGFCGKTITAGQLRAAARHAS